MEQEREQEFQEFVTFHITSKDGEDVEMAVVDEFEFERKQYVVGAVVVDDTINEDDGIYIYRGNVQDGELTVEKITDMKEYEKIANAYLDMQ